MFAAGSFDFDAAASVFDASAAEAVVDYLVMAIFHVYPDEVEDFHKSAGLDIAHVLMTIHFHNSPDEIMPDSDAASAVTTAAHIAMAEPADFDIASVATTDVVHIVSVVTKVDSEFEIAADSDSDVATAVLATLEPIDEADYIGVADCMVLGVAAGDLEEQADEAKVPCSFAAPMFAHAAEGLLQLEDAAENIRNDSID